MTLSRRSFVNRAVAGLAASLGGGVFGGHAFAGSAGGAHLDNARQAARWIDASTQRDDAGGLRWPSDPRIPNAVSPFLYSGSAGIVAFFTALGRYTGEAEWIARAEGGARALVADAAGAPAGAAALYTGRAGVAHVLADLGAVTGDDRWKERAHDLLHQTIARATVTPAGLEWSDCPDIVAGGAGVALVLARYGQLWGDQALIDAAARVGDQLIASALPAEGDQLWWSIDRTSGRNYPNFSHGTAGVAYALAELHAVTGRAAYLDAALKGAAYLDAVATRKDDGALIFHRADGGLDRFYVGWCHGPAGTARLFYRLNQITGDGRHGAMVDALTRGLHATGAPLRFSDGYWNNVSQCCGNAGIIQHHIDLLRHWRTDATREALDPFIADTLRRADRTSAGLSWTQAENRVQPDNLIAQTGLMQGAAGLGLLFLQLHALDQGVEWGFPLPDTPFRRVQSV